ncbi:SDR family NAD(P)-dependent oxidoreductase, partial [Streptomyces sp. SID6041]|nr:SDR family NAD(P)-dependent oxidoreductase [Streptomyces sp. SID6041]
MTNQAGQTDQAGQAIQRVYVVTGGGTGIGAATARALTRAGHKVAVSGRRPEPLRLVA